MAKVLLVIGNGFDLKCGLKSSFNDYLKSDYYSPIIEKIHSIDERLSNSLKFPSKYDGTAVYNKYKETFDGLTFWDLYFGLPYYYDFTNIREWYDFENKLNSFIKSFFYGDEEYLEITRINQTILSSTSYTDKQYKYKLLLYLFLYRISDSFKTKVINKTLFEQLKQYEKRFGEYIRTIQSSNENYLANAETLLGKLVNSRDELSYLTNFNYSNLFSLVPDIWHINGDSDNPIFGVDYSDVNRYSPSRFSYTKTYRRLELSGKESYLPLRKDYSKVIVFGHSLNLQDYNYFYSLFNALGLDTSRNEKRKGYYVEFAYSKYNEMTSEEVRTETIKRVLELFRGYNAEILHESNFRLMDILFCSGAIRFREIE